MSSEVDKIESSDDQVLAILSVLNRKMFFRFIMFAFTRKRPSVSFSKRTTKYLKSVLAIVSGTLERMLFAIEKTGVS